MLLHARRLRRRRRCLHGSGRPRRSYCRRRFDGALFAQRAALSYPHRVRRLVLVAAQTPANEAVMGLVEEVRALEDPVPPEFVRGFQESTIYHPVSQEFLYTVVSESLKLTAHVWRDYMEGAVLSIRSEERRVGKECRS